MDIKRNIFESPAKMPKQYEPCAVPFSMEETNARPLPGMKLHEQDQADVVHVRSPRIGEQK